MNSRKFHALRRYALEIYRAGLRAVDAYDVMIKYLTEVQLNNPTWVLAIGKAAPLMAKATQIGASRTWCERGLIITKDHHCTLCSAQADGFDCIEAGHPFPDQRSLSAGARVLEFIAQAPADVDFLLLISGGASAVCEVLPEGIKLEDLQCINHWALSHAWPIGPTNALRKSISCIKGGRLAERLAAHRVRQCLLSDVPGDVLEDIGSGLCVADSQDRLAGYAVPDWIQALQQHAPPKPTPSAACFRHINTSVLASNRQALQACAQQAQQLGLPVRLQAELSGEAVASGQAIAEAVRQGPPGVYLYGGETVVKLPSSPGRGGRCQSLALAAALAIEGQADTVVLAGSTDGSDGPGEIAGAMVDGETCLRARDAGLDARHHLARADAGTYLEETGDLLDTGPTGTNVMDLVIAIRR